MVPPRGDVLQVRDDDGKAARIKLVWSQKTLECIHMLGFELVDSASRLPVAS